MARAIEECGGEAGGEGAGRRVGASLLAKRAAPFNPLYCAVVLLGPLPLELELHVVQPRTKCAEQVALLLGKNARGPLLERGHPIEHPSVRRAKRLDACPSALPVSLRCGKADVHNIYAACVLGVGG